MALGKAVFAKALDLIEAALGKALVVTACDHARDHLFLKQMDSAAAPEGRQRLAQLIDLGVIELGCLHGDPHRLLLEQRHALGLAENLPQLIWGPCSGAGDG